MIDLTTLVPGLQDGRADAYDEFSRYRGLAIRTFVDAAGREHAFVDRRIVPPPETMNEAGRVVVEDGDRLDRIAAAQFGEARWWWRIADANRALAPAALTGPDAVGTTLRITLAAGVPVARRD